MVVVTGCITSLAGKGHRLHGYGLPVMRAGVTRCAVPYRDADVPKREPRPLVMLSQKPLGDRVGAALLDLCV